MAPASSATSSTPDTASLKTRTAWAQQVVDWDMSEALVPHRSFGPDFDAAGPSDYVTYVCTAVLGIGDEKFPTREQQLAHFDRHTESLLEAAPTETDRRLAIELFSAQRPLLAGCRDHIQYDPMLPDQIKKLDEALGPKSVDSALTRFVQAVNDAGIYVHLDSTP